MKMAFFVELYFILGREQHSDFKLRLKRKPISVLCIMCLQIMC